MVSNFMVESDGCLSLPLQVNHHNRVSRRISIGGGSCSWRSRRFQVIIFIQIKFMVDIEVQIPSAFDPFSDVDQDSGGGVGVNEYVHICIQQINDRKSLMTVQGLKKKLGYEKILKALKKELY
ncbi:hypothetical protein L2E82_18198 [Cichorium intybus]|uniref:Uncharacterized protein n=1 Tax=Cichorium intybus TaxID=13427 RepID=A0ACB9FAD7_CICIN|nr:hypothetical protein L2E82_18198 [Cichorium intybus]